MSSRTKCAMSTVTHRRARSIGLAITAALIVIATMLAAVSSPTAGTAHAGDEGIAAAGASTTTTGGSTTTSSPNAATSTSTTTLPAILTGSSGSVAGIVIPATPLKPAKRLRQAGTLLFPMQTAPRCAILDNFGDPRSGGRRHEGTDILATLDQEIYAVADGVLKVQYVVGGRDSSLSGNAWTLALPDGTYYFYAHLSRFADGLTVGSTVRRGDLIGYVGDTGDPGPGNYHLHFEVHPQGGAAVNALTVLEVPGACSIT